MRKFIIPRESYLLEKLPALYTGTLQSWAVGPVKMDQTCPLMMLPNSISSSVPGAKKLRVLVVEDHSPTRLAMGRLIREAGAEVVTARDGEEGLGYLLTQRFDVLLTDLRMPGMDGVELVDRCMKLPQSHRPARVIAISGEYDAGVLHGLPVQFLAKPLNVDSLLSMLGGQPN